MKRRFFAALCALIALCGLLTACDRSPDSLETVRAYLDEALTIKHEYLSTTTTENDNGNQENTYSFVDANGVAFTITSGWYRGGVVFPRKDTTCNYLDALMALHEDALAEDFGTTLSWEKRTADHAHYILSVERYVDLPTAANCVSAALNTINPFPVKRDIYDRYFPYSMPYIEVRHPGVFRCFEDIYFPCAGEARMAQEQVLEELQYQYADTVKRGLLVVDEQLPDGISTKYPVSRIDEVYANGQQLHGMNYTFEYSRDLQDYITCRLNPCKLVGDTSSFKELVESFGGTYSCPKTGKASWSIGGDTWKATVQLDARGNYRSMTLMKNGRKISLTPPAQSNASVLLRTFSLSDLEAMLGICATVDQQAQTIELTRDPG